VASSVGTGRDLLPFVTVAGRIADRLAWGAGADLDCVGILGVTIAAVTVTPSGMSRAATTVSSSAGGAVDAPGPPSSVGGLLSRMTTNTNARAARKTPMSRMSRLERFKLRSLPGRRV
jgi:hypothetical protein